jgi:peptide/nickel transport system substrate-binding protein
MRKVIWVSIVLAAFLMAGVCFAQPKGELMVLQGAEINATDPAKYNSIPESNFALAVFDTLYLNDEKAIPQPRLALSHKLINETTWEFPLRKGVKFHNGVTMTAKDVKFSFDRALDPQTKTFFMPFISTIKEVKIIDDYTIQIITSGPDPILLKRLSFSLFILPADLFQEKGAEAFFKNPVGTGPFKFVSWTRNDRMVLEANEAYWDGAPKIKRLIFRPVPEVATKIAELQTGNADVITNIPPFLVDQVKNSPNAVVQSVPSGRVMFLYINCLADGPLKDKRVRQALNYAVDRKAIIDNILKGSGVQVPVNLTPLHFAYDADLKPYPYDPEKAKKLLAEAGYAKGLKLVFNSPSGRYILDKEIAQAIAGMYNAVGIETDMKIHEWGSYTQILTGKRLQDIGFIGWSLVLADPDSTFVPYFTPESAFSYYSTPELKEKILRGRTMLDEKKRAELYKEIQKDIFEAAPLVFLHQQIDHYGVAKRVQGFQVRGDELMLFNKVSKQ